MVFGLIRKADDANFQSFEDSGICSFQEERNESLLGPATGGSGTTGRENSSSLHICDLLGDLLDDDKLEQDVDDDLLMESLKHDVTVSTRTNLLRAPSLKVESPQRRKVNHLDHSNETATTVRNREFLRAPSMDRENEYVGIIEESNSESYETSDDSEYGSSSEPLQFELPIAQSTPAHESIAKSFDCLESSAGQGTSSADDCNVSITFTTCFDVEDDPENNSDGKLSFNGNLIDIADLEANQIIDEETAQRIRAHLQQKRDKEPVTQIFEKGIEQKENCGNNRERKHRSPSHKDRTPSPGSASPSHRSVRKKSPHVSPNQATSKTLQGSEDVTSRRSPRKEDGNECAPGRRGSRKVDERNREERRKSYHASSDSQASTEELQHCPSDRLDETLSSTATAVASESPSSHPCSDEQSPKRENDTLVDETKKKSLLGSPGKMMMKFLSQRNVSQSHDKERPTFRRTESQSEIGSPRLDVDESKLRAQSHGDKVQDDGISKSNESSEQPGTMDCSSRSSPRSSKRFANWILQGRRPSISNSGECQERETDAVAPSPSTDISSKDSDIAPSDRIKCADAGAPRVSASKSSLKIDKHIRESNLNNNHHEQQTSLKIRPAMMRSSSLDVLYSPVKNAASPEMQIYGDDVKDSMIEHVESKQARSRSISAGANPGVGRKLQNVSDREETSNRKVSSQHSREQSISPAKRSAVSASSKHKKDLSQTQHPKPRQSTSTSSKAARPQSIMSNSCHVSKTTNEPRNESPSHRSPGSRQSVKRIEDPDSPSKRRSSLTHQKGLSFSVHASPTKRKSGTSTAVTRRLSALASVPAVDLAMHTLNDVATSNPGPSTSNPKFVSEAQVRAGKGRNVVISSAQAPSKVKSESMTESHQHRVMSQSVHSSPSKRKIGLNTSTGTSRKPQSTTEPVVSYKGKVSPDNIKSPDFSHPSGASKSANGHLQASTRTRKATVEDLKKDFELAVEESNSRVEDCGDKTQHKSAVRKIQIFMNKKAT